jgi:leucine dehydrogenase
MSFEVIAKHGEHEQVVFCHNKDVGLKAIIAIHNTGLGPALGGTRMWNYKSEDEALVDVLRLSKGMTYKAAVAGLNLGGGKAVIIGDPKTQKTEGLFRAFGQFVNSLNGRYITAEDVGTSEKDMEYVYMETPWVTGIPKGFGGGGDPSPHTAHGVFMAIKASIKHKLGVDSVKGLRIAVQGLGSVGFHLLSHLDSEGADISVADIDAERVRMASSKYKVKVLDANEIITSECDVLAPCALGAVINDQTIGRLKCKIISGGANNQLAEPRHGSQLREMGILYAPDYVANAGGLINVFTELEGYSFERANAKTLTVYDSCMKVFRMADKKGIPTNVAADFVAEERINQISKLRHTFSGRNPRTYMNMREVNNR